MVVLTCKVMFIMTSAALVTVNSSSTPTQVNNWFHAILIYFTSLVQQKMRNENVDVRYVSGLFSFLTNIFYLCLFYFCSNRSTWPSWKRREDT